MSTAPSAAVAGAGDVIDPRGLRFAAGVTSVVLAAALILGPGWGLPLLAIQLLAFAAGTLLGVRYQPYGWLFRKLVRPRIGPPAAFEDAGPPRFAQAVGLLFAVIGVVGLLVGADAVFYTAVGVALLAALLNAGFDFCVGCELYLLGRRVIGTRPGKSGSRS
ncbi:MAG: DUF4395 domain-containing protein [Brooklawnia sp.]|nr:DUF4395 domain-containing protein [Brooklawnia sp.]